MGFKVKRVSPPTRTLNVPVGVAWDDQGQLVIPHHNLLMPDGRRLHYAGPWLVEGHGDGATWRTDNGLRVGASINELFTALGPLLFASLVHLRKDPSWNEIKAVKNLFLGPDVDAMMMLPAEEHFTNLATIPETYRGSSADLIEDTFSSYPVER
jgi:hypothetical protein